MKKIANDDWTGAGLIPGVCALAGLGPAAVTGNGSAEPIFPRRTRRGLGHGFGALSPSITP